MLQPEKFSELLDDPNVITGSDTKSIAELVKKYPYFQAARALYLKCLKNSESLNYNNQLKITAAYTTDRSVLFDFIVSKEFNQNAISKSIKKNFEHLKTIVVNEFEDISVNKSVTLDDQLKKQIKDTEGVLDPDLFEEKIKIGNVAALKKHDSESKTYDIKFFSSIDNKSAANKLQIGKPLDFNADERHSFSEWLNLTSLKPIDRSNSESENKSAIEKKNEYPKKINKEKVGLKKDKFDLIDRFLETNPKIVPSKDYTPKPLLYRDEVHHQGLMTETLARIYLEQKNYDKAIQSYKILSLKYPEKSSFFADQIKAVRELQDQK